MRSVRMSLRYLLIALLVAVSLVLAACAPSATVTPIPTRALPTPEPTPEATQPPPTSAPSTAAPTPTATATPVPTVAPTTEPTPADDEPAASPEVLASAGVQAAIAQLAEQLGVAPEEVVVRFADRAEWPNGCLGLAAPDEFCTQAIVPGYGGLLEAAGQQFEFRTDEQGNVVKLIPGAALAARQVLAQQLQLTLEDIQLLQIEPVEWPDACLGVPAADEACADVIVPGYRVLLQAQGGRYEFHTDETGGEVRLATAPETEIEDPVLRWTQQGERCERAALNAEQVAFGPCEGPQMVVSLATPQRQEQLADFVATYRSFEAETPAGSIVFTGSGTQRATAAEQRMLAEWARLVAQEAAAGRSGASWGLAFAWHREGGIAGFCDDLTVYVTGDVLASSCRGQQPRDLGASRLTAEQLEQLYTWVDTLAPFEEEQTDDATADAMTIRLVFSGAGAETARDADIAEIQAWAAELYASLS